MITKPTQREGQLEDGEKDGFLNKLGKFIDLVTSNSLPFGYVIHIYPETFLILYRI